MARADGTPDSGGGAGRGEVEVRGCRRSVLAATVAEAEISMGGGGSCEIGRRAVDCWGDCWT